MPIDVQALYIFLKCNTPFIDFPELNFRGFSDGKVMLLMYWQARDIQEGCLDKSNCVYAFLKDLLGGHCVWVVDRLSRSSTQCVMWTQSVP